MPTLGGVRKCVSVALLVISVAIGSSEAQITREVTNWHVPEAFNTKPEAFSLGCIHPISEEDLTEFWAAGSEDGVSAIYYVKDDKWDRQQAVPDVKYIIDISMVTPNRGWAIGSMGILEYDGVFWRKKVTHEKKTLWGAEYMSIISENEVWFGNGYRMKEGIYEKKFSPVDVGSIFMKDSLNGVYLSRNAIMKTSDGENWSYVGSNTDGNGALDDSLKIWFSHSYNLISSGGNEQVIFNKRGLNFVKIVGKEVWFTASFYREGTPFNFLPMPALCRYSIVDSTWKINSAPDSLFDEGGGAKQIINKLTVLPNYIVATFRVSRRLPEVAFFVSPSLSTVDELRLDNLPPAELPQVDSPLYHTITIANEGDGFLEIESITIEGDMFLFQPDGYTLSGNVQYDPLQEKRYIPAHDSLQVVIAYVPPDQGFHTGQLALHTNDPVNPVWTVDITAASAGTKGPIIELPSAVDFGKVLIGSSKKKSLLIGNSGSQPLNLLSIASSDPNFEATSLADTVKIQPGAERRFDIEFVPPDTSLQEAQITILSNDPTQPSRAVQVRGKGSPIPPPHAVLRTGSITPTSRTEDQDITLVVTGDFPASNASVKDYQVTVEDSTIRVDITSQWQGDYPGPVDAQPTSWQIEKELGRLAVRTYAVEVFINGNEFISSRLRINPRNISDGLIAIDFGLAEGDQEQRIIGSVQPGEVIDLQLHTDGTLDINGWSITIDYDPEMLVYKQDSFQPSDYLNGFVPLVDAQPGQVSVGGAVLGAEESNSEKGMLGELSFEALEGFEGTTELVITENNFRFTGGGSERYTVQAIATLTSDAVEPPVVGDFDGSGKIDFTDFFAFADAFGGSDAQFDLDKSGSVNFDDFFIFADNFGKNARAKLFALAHEYLGLPVYAYLEPTYPNPFNSSATIRYFVSFPGSVRLDIYNLAGQRIRTWNADVREAGVYEEIWDGTDERGDSVSSGIYWVRFQAGLFVEFQKMLLLR